MTGRERLVAAAALLLVIGLIFLLGQAPGDERPSAAFCSLYPRVDHMVAMLQRRLEGEPEPGDLPLSNYQSSSELAWNDEVAGEGPQELAEAATLVASAVRTAAADEDPAALQAPGVSRAVARVEAGATEACEEGA